MRISAKCRCICADPIESSCNVQQSIIPGFFLISSLFYCRQRIEAKQSETVIDGYDNAIGFLSKRAGRKCSAFSSLIVPAVDIKKDWKVRFVAIRASNVQGNSSGFIPKKFGRYLYLTISCFIFTCLKTGGLTGNPAFFCLFNAIPSIKRLRCFPAKCSNRCFCVRNAIPVKCSASFISFQ